MTPRIGITIGKFMPLHLGHEFMIYFGARMTDKFHVIVSGKETDEIPLTTRYNWVKESVRLFKNQHQHWREFDITVHYHIDNSPEPKEIDQHGTVLDEEFQEYWRQEFLRIAPDATHFVSSDRYGKTMADLLEIKWLPVDPHRELIDISATKIRQDPVRHFNLISQAAKHYYIKTVAVIGPESVGKSTLTKRLAESFGTTSVPEYGRILSEAKNNQLTREDFYDIMNGQLLMITNAIDNAQHPVIITDTEGYTTMLFSEIYLNDPNLTVDLNFIAGFQNFSLYILLAPTVDWIDDGTRVLGNQSDRQAFYERLRGFLDKNNKPYIVVDSRDFDARFKQAESAITELITTGSVK